MVFNIFIDYIMQLKSIVGLIEKTENTLL